MNQTIEYMASPVKPALNLFQCRTLVLNAILLSIASETLNLVSVFLCN
jgi:hypothetical protein